MRFRLPALAFAALLAASPAFAAFHFIHVKEVFAGSQAHPTAQLRPSSGLRRLPECRHRTQRDDVRRAWARRPGRSTFAAPVGNGDNQMTIFVATPDAATIFNMHGRPCDDGRSRSQRRQGLLGRLVAGLLRRLGKLHGRAMSEQPYNVSGGLISGYAARRRLDICGGIASLEACDDTDDSANDWITAIPHPIKNGGTPGQTPPATCGNGTLEGLEGCDDNDTRGRRRLLGGLQGRAHRPSRRRTCIVDVTALAPPDSNVNGVLEPGETVQIEPTLELFRRGRHRPHGPARDLHRAHGAAPRSRATG